MYVYLVRHGEAGAASSDSARRLTPAGREEVSAIAGFLRMNGAQAASIWHSSKVRARETAEILARDGGLGGEILELPGLLPEDHPSEILSAIDAESVDLCIVGHLPSIAFLASSLLTAADSRPFVLFETATTLCLERNGRRSWHLKWMISPAQLRG
jgi:phosphohistidine phosphatase